MRRLLRVVRTVIVSLACLAWVLPLPLARASQPAGGMVSASAAGIVDVRLDGQRLLRGTVVDTAGQPVAARPVVLQPPDGTVFNTQTDAAGGFVFRDVRGGVHRLVTGDRCVTCRVWTPAAAPPAAAGQLIVVAEPPVVRGQQPFSAVFTNPLFIGLVVAAAIAIPIVVHNAQDDHPPGS